VAFQRSYFTWRFSFSVNGVVTTAVVERVEEKAHIKSGVETDVYHIYKDKKSIIHQGKDNIDGNTHLRAGDRVKIEHLKKPPGLIKDSPQPPLVVRPSLPGAGKEPYCLTPLAS